MKVQSCFKARSSIYAKPAKKKKQTNKHKVLGNISVTLLAVFWTGRSQFGDWQPAFVKH